MRYRITDVEPELRAAGHQVGRTFEDGPDPTSTFSDAKQAQVGRWSRLALLPGGPTRRAGRSVSR